MSKDTPTETPAWAYPGFERDFKIFLLSLDAKAISRGEYRDIMRAANVPLPPEPDPGSLTLETPRLDRPTLNAPQVQLPDLYLVPENPDFGFDPNTGFVYDLQSGMIVGQLQPDADDTPSPLVPEDERPGELALEPGDPGDLDPEVIEGGDFESPSDPLTEDQVDDG